MNTIPAQEIKRRGISALDVLFLTNDQRFRRVPGLRVEVPA